MNKKIYLKDYCKTTMKNYNIKFNNVIYKYAYATLFKITFEDINNYKNKITLSYEPYTKDEYTEIEIIIPEPKEYEYYIHFSDKSFEKFYGNDVYVTSIHHAMYLGSDVLNLLSLKRAYDKKGLYYMYIVKGPKKYQSWDGEYEFINTELEIVKRYTLDTNTDMDDEIYYILKNIQLDKI